VVKAYRAPPQLAAVKDWPKLALYHKYRVGKIAADRHVSLAELRSFCKHTLRNKPTTKQWLRQLRLAQAERQLYNGFSTEAVARELGYKDASHFCNEFKRERGRSPQIWLALVRKWEGQQVPFTAVELPNLPQERKPFDETQFPWLGL
jgi:AraC-like DNA-binding protein